MTPNNILALDVGSVRVGVAMARADVRIPVGLETLMRTADDFWEQLTQLISQHAIGCIVLGLPRGLDGQDTAQTRAIRDFAKELKQHTKLPISWQDEALTSIAAETLLTNAGKNFRKADIDALAACYILDDYLSYNKVTV